MHRRRKRGGPRGGPNILGEGAIICCAPPPVIQTCFGKSSLNKQNFVNITKLPGLRPLDPYINVNYGIFHPSMDSLARRNIVSLKSQVLDIGFHLHQSGSNMSIFCWTAQSHWPDSFSEK